MEDVIIYHIEAALLMELENPNPMARLKKTVTKEKGGIKSDQNNNKSINPD